MEGKFSVIIPTMLKCVDTTNKLLSTLYEDPAVGEVIIIDNASKSYEEEMQLLYSGKTEYYIPGQNLYVNPSWNMGVSMSKYDNICLLNDDVLIPSYTFGYLSNIDLHDVGIIGIHPSTIFPLSASPKVYNWGLFGTNIRSNGYGIMMVFHKDHYVVIPDDIKVWVGDDILFHTQIARGRMNALLTIPVKTDMSVTSNDPVFDPIKQNDIQLYEQYKQLYL